MWNITGNSVCYTVLRYFCNRILDLRISHTDQKYHDLGDSLNDSLIELIFLGYIPHTPK